MLLLRTNAQDSEHAFTSSSVIKNKRTIVSRPSKAGGKGDERAREERKRERGKWEGGGMICSRVLRDENSFSRDSRVKTAGVPDGTIVGGRCLHVSSLEPSTKWGFVDCLIRSYTSTSPGYIFIHKTEANMNHAFCIQGVHLTAAWVVGLSATCGATAFAFAPSLTRSATSHIVHYQGVKTASGTMLMVHKLNMVSSFAELEDASKRMPVFVDLEYDDLEHIKSFRDTSNNCDSIDEDDSSPATPECSSDSPSAREVWIARLLLLLSAALYGTNFTMVKSLDESLSVGVSSTLRFGFAAIFMLPWLLAPINEDLKTIARKKYDKCKEGIANWEEPTRLSAGLAGMEIGVYNSIGYITQAVGLKTIAANKVSFDRALLVSLTDDSRQFCFLCFTLECFHMFNGSSYSTDSRLPFWQRAA